MLFLTPPPPPPLSKIEIGNGQIDIHCIDMSSLKPLKALESNVKRVLERYILADASQIKREMSYDPYPLLETFENYIRDKNAGRESRSSYVGLSSDARHIIVASFLMLVRELNEIADPTDLMQVSLIPVPAHVEKELDSIQDVIARKTAMASAATRERIRFVVDEIVKNNDMCIAQFMLNCINSVYIDPSSLLASVFDPDNYFKQKFDAVLHDKYKNNDTLINLVHSLFDGYLKAIAFIISRYIWYDHCSVSKDMMLGLLFSRGMPSDMIERLKSIAENNREKVQKSKSKKEKSCDARKEPLKARKEPPIPTTNADKIEAPVDTAAQINDSILADLNALASQQ
jgi:hypothetical protein